MEERREMKEKGIVRIIRGGGRKGKQGRDGKQLGEGRDKGGTLTDKRNRWGRTLRY